MRKLLRNTMLASAAIAVLSSAAAAQSTEKLKPNTTHAQSRNVVLVLPPEGRLIGRMARRCWWDIAGVER